MGINASDKGRRGFDLGGSIFSQSPITVAWECTRSCPLKCKHCRADAQLVRHPDELTTDQAQELIVHVKSMGAKVFVITGGDPLARPDTFELISFAKSLGLHVGCSPSVTGRVTKKSLTRLRDAGCDTVHISLDGASAKTHDEFRGVAGSYKRTWLAIDAIQELGMALQVGTTVTQESAGELQEIATQIASLQMPVWSWTLFFLIPTGRASDAEIPDAIENERILSWVIKSNYPFRIRTIEAPFIVRVREQYEKLLSDSGGKDDFEDLVKVVPYNVAVRDGDGFCFVSHTGEVYPSGFLQASAGNVKNNPIEEIYRTSDLFVELRDRTALKGRCGQCEYKYKCGGSRARAWAVSGDPLAEDPGCVYVPVGVLEAI